MEGKLGWYGMCGCAKKYRDGYLVENLKGSCRDNPILRFVFRWVFISRQSGTLQIHKSVYRSVLAKACDLLMPESGLRPAGDQVIYAAAEMATVMSNGSSRSLLHG